MNLFSDPNLKFDKRVHNENYAGVYAEVGKLWGTEKLGFHVEAIDPDTFSCPYHFHHDEEELFIALKGSAMVRQGDEFFEMKEGDLVFFKTGVAHQPYNHTKEPFLYFALSNKSPADFCEYPDSKKILDRLTSTLTQNGVEIKDYWKDEENPRSKWPAK